MTELVRITDGLSFVTGAVLRAGDVVEVVSSNGERLLCRKDGQTFPNVPRGATVCDRRERLKERLCAAVDALHGKSVVFGEVLCDAMSLHAIKSKDYGTESDPYANVRASEEFGVDAWKGALIRSNDKITRLKQFARRGELENESAEDSMRDLIVYFAIVLLLYREASREADCSSK